MADVAVGTAVAEVEEANAIKASGAIVRLRPEGFQTLLDRLLDPIVVMTVGGWFRTTYQYLTSYKGFIFYTKSRKELYLPAEAEVIRADGIWTPS